MWNDMGSQLNSAARPSPFREHRRRLWAFHARRLSATSVHRVGLAARDTDPPRGDRPARVPTRDSDWGGGGRNPTNRVLTAPLAAKLRRSLVTMFPRL